MTDGRCVIRQATEAYSERRLVTGLATAALIAWKLMVMRAISKQMDARLSQRSTS